MFVREEREIKWLGNARNDWKELEMVVNDRTWLELREVDKYGWKRLEMDGLAFNGWM